ncbi:MULTISPECIES: DUF2628 domain-containing protein [Bacillus cereus group]|uniref:DUF2628 domain-containing protein n=1 Tax=Bacillus thuringiensis TaxID=1428 RepID=A0A1C4GDW5_BACTU|nr:MULTISPECIES: DUF2628 domain-containing protein [Bacillus cereus group]MDP1458802.1 DUF2628 domain-containing protein [Bacillus wiedmannii]MED2016386.1 DUF2628 domain-containing protein [Bacillus wiedmannii]MED3024682.1 DUF2628 domain-containing protein [Bacillus wiedmannii]OTX96157.1 hypothetical protein BK729_20685 [Bacillus thuringiensis serovar wratislaviensis]OUB53793.1 hypothetical protein BK743_28295 [Bacillus thuringiensis serovar sylvestriensis]
MYVRDTVLQETISPQQLHTVVQKNTAYYDFKWGKIENPEQGNTWNWVAFFFPVFWLAYRKMYKLFIILTLLAVPSIFVTPFIDIPDGIFLSIGLVFQLGMMIFTGWQGNRLYYKHAVRILHKEENMPDHEKAYYLQLKGGASLARMIGVQVIVALVFGGATFGLSYLPTEPNIKNVVRASDEGFTLEIMTDNPTWKLVTKEKDYDVVEFTGYDYTEKKNVKIKFAVYFAEDYFEWQEVYENNKKISEEELEEYQFYIEENGWGF